MSTPEPTQSPVAEGDVIAGKYKVEKILGVGGMGVVVAAMHVHLRQRVAIKFLLPGAAPEMVTRFMREARASAKLKSEHIARVLDVAELPTGAPYMVMEYLEGSDFSRVLRKRGALPIDDAVDYLLQACEAIAEAHSVGIVHRDLKPANLFLTKAADGSASVKVLDFGISKDTSEQAGEEEMELTRTTAVLGSPYYMAPEQFRSTRTVDARADIWSIGIILYQLVTKVVPFKAGAFVELALMVINDEPTPPSTHLPDIPPALEAAILRCLDKKPAARFASVAEFATTIAPFGRAGAMGSAERIARTQGAPQPVFERPSSVSVAPPPPSTVSGSGPRSVGSALSSGPAIDIPRPTGPVGSSVPTTAGLGPGPADTAPSGHGGLGAAGTGSASGHTPAPASVGSASDAPGAPRPFAMGETPATPARPVIGSLAASSPPSVPPPAATTGSATGGKDAAHAATASTWAGAQVAPQSPPGSGTRMVIVGALLGAVAVAGTLVALKARTTSGRAAAAESTAVAPSPPPEPGITSEPAPAAPSPVQPVSTAAPGAVEVTAGKPAPALGAPVTATTTSPGARSTARPVATGEPRAPAAAPPTAAPAVPPPAPVTAAPSPPPAPVTAAPAPKKNVLDIDIK